MAFTNLPASGTAAVTRHRNLGIHKSACCKRGSVNVRFAPKVTKVLPRKNPTLRAKADACAILNVRWTARLA
jgi:hypothetical protein